MNKRTPSRTPRITGTSLDWFCSNTQSIVSFLLLDSQLFEEKPLADEITKLIQALRLRHGWSYPGGPAKNRSQNPAAPPGGMGDEQLPGAVLP